MKTNEAKSERLKRKVFMFSKRKMNKLQRIKDKARKSQLKPFWKPIMVASCLVVLVATAGESILQNQTAYKGSLEQARGVRGQVWKWDYHFASEIQSKDKAVGLAFDGSNLHANTKHESLLYFNHRVHVLAFMVSNHQQAVEFTNCVERWITNLPSGPE